MSTRNKILAAAIFSFILVAATAFWWSLPTETETRSSNPIVNAGKECLDYGFLLMDTGEIELGEEALGECIENNSSLKVQLRTDEESARREFEAIMKGWSPPWPDNNGKSISSLTDKQIASHLNDVEGFISRHSAGYHFKLAVTVKALILYHREKYSACLRWLTDNPSAIPDFAIYLSSLCSIELNDHITAFALIDRLMEQHPESLYASRAGLMKAKMLMDEERYRSAISSVMDLAMKNSDPFTRGDALLLAASIYLAGGDPENSKKMIMEIPVAYPSIDVGDFLESHIDPEMGDISVDEAIILSEYFLKKKRGYPIVKLLSKIKNLPPRASYLLSRGYYLTGNIKESEKLIDKLNTKNINEETRGETCLLKADILKSKSKLDSSISQLLGCMANYQALHRDALERMALIYLIKGDINARVKTLMRLLEVAPDHEMSGEYLLEVARAHLTAGRRANALEIYKILATAEPPKYASSEALFWIGKIYFDSGDRNSAGSYFRQTREKFPYSYFYFRAGDYLTSMGETAPDYLERAVTEHKSIPYEPVGNLYLMTANALRHMNLYDESLRHFTAASPQNPDRAAIGMSRVFRELGRMPESVKVLETRIKTNPEFFYHVMGSPYLCELLFPTLFIADIKNEASKVGMSPAWPLAIIRQESRFKADATSSSNAKGLMQIIPSTGKWIAGNVGDKKHKPEMLYTPSLNIRYGVWYFDHLLGIKELKGNTALAVASYNGGPGNVKKWIALNGIDDIDLYIEKIPRDETRGYVKKVLLNYFTYEIILNAHDGKNGNYKNMN